MIKITKEKKCNSQVLNSDFNTEIKVGTKITNLKESWNELVV